METNDVDQENDDSKLKIRTLQMKKWGIRWKLGNLVYDNVHTVFEKKNYEYE